MPAPRMSPSDWLRLLLLSFLWGAAFFFVEVAVPHLPPLTIVFIRVGLAALALAAVLVLAGLAFPRGAGVWGALMVMGLLNNVIPFGLFATAQGEIASGLAAILNATTPLFGVIVAHLFTRDERLSPARLVGVLLGIGGVAVMMGGATTAGTSTALAQAACLAAAFSYAVASVWGRRFRGLGIAPLATAFGQLACASLWLLPVVLWVDRPWTQTAPPPEVTGALVAVALLCTALAYPLFFRLLASAGATNILLVTLLIPVSAILLGVLVLSETLALRHFVGLGLIALGLAAIDGRVWDRLRRAGLR